MEAIPANNSGWGSLWVKYVITVPSAVWVCAIQMCPQSLVWIVHECRTNIAIKQTQT